MLNKSGIRELCYVVLVDEIRPIEGKDRVECAVVGGWTVMVRKGQFNVGDPAIYFEVDSKVPEKEPFMFLAEKHFKIKIQKYGQFYSQGLLMHAEDFGWKNITGIYEHGKVRKGIAKPDGTTFFADDESRFVTKELEVTYATKSDRVRKSDADKRKYDSMAARNQNLFRKKPFRWLMRREWGRKLLFIFFGKKRDNNTSFPTKFPHVKKTDQERCLIGQTKVITDKGIFQIQKIVNHRLDVKVLSVNENNELEFKKIADYQKFCNDDKLLTIKYSYKPGTGRTNSLCCTTDHRVLTQRGYVKASDLTCSDYLKMPCECYREDVLPLIYGMLLGDSHIYIDKRNKSNLKIGFTQGEKQLDYLKYKHDTLSSAAKIYRKGEGSLLNRTSVFGFMLESDSTIDKWVRQVCMENGKKKVTRTLTDALTEESLAFWYMDDGNLSYRCDDKFSPRIRINTQGFSFEENELLCDMLRNRFGVDCKVRLERGYYLIYVTTEGTKKFLEMVTPYMCKSMGYKTIPSMEHLLESKKHTYKKCFGLADVSINRIEVGQTKSKTIPKNHKYVYDLEVENTHNFVTDSVVSHNCENMTWVLNDKTPFIVTEKCDGSSATYILEKKRWDKFEFYVCSRNVRMYKEDQKCFHDKNYYWEAAKQYDIENKLKDYLTKHPNLQYVCWQGELCGPSIQSNPHKLNNLHLFLFHFIDSEIGKYDIKKAEKIWDYYHMEYVPITGDITLPDDFEQFKESADGFYDVSVTEGKKNVAREGFVYYKTDDPNFSFKNVSRRYLLSHKDDSDDEEEQQ